MSRYPPRWPQSRHPLGWRREPRASAESAALAPHLCVEQQLARRAAVEEGVDHVGLNDHGGIDELHVDTKALRQWRVRGRGSALRLWYRRNPGR